MSRQRVVWFSLHYPIHINPRRSDPLRIDPSRLNNLINLRDRHIGGWRHHRVKRPRSAYILKISEGVSPLRTDQREVGSQPMLQQVGTPIKLSDLLAFFYRVYPLQWACRTPRCQHRPLVSSRPRCLAE